MSQDNDARRVVEDRPYWLFADGTKLPIFAGGSEDADGGDGGDEGSDEGTEDLGEAGKKALTAEREGKRVADKARKEAERERDELRAWKEKHETESKSETEKAIEKARKEAATEARTAAMAEVNKERVADRIRAVAATKYRDPEDAVLYLLSEFEGEDASKFDRDALVKRMDEHLAEKDYLAKDDKKVRGDADGGKRGTKDKPEVQPGVDRLRAAYAATSKT